MKNSTVRAIICAALGNIIWGFSFLLTKVGLAVAPDPSVMLSHRFLISTLVMGSMILFGKQKISFENKNWKPVVLLPLLQVSYYLLETYGVLYTNSTISGLVLAVGVAPAAGRRGRGGAGGGRRRSVRVAGGSRQRAGLANSPGRDRLDLGQVLCLCRARVFAVRQGGFAVRLGLCRAQSPFAVRQLSLPCACARQTFFSFFFYHFNYEQH
jgi:hypothetical protein